MRKKTPLGEGTWVSASRSSQTPEGSQEHFFSIVTFEVLCQEREGNCIYVNFFTVVLFDRFL